MKPVIRFFKILLAVLVLFGVEARAQLKTAALVANSRSVALGQATGVWPGYGTVYNLFTTYDGKSGIPFHDEVNGSWIFGEELRPRTGLPGVYEGDFITFNSSYAYIEYGAFTLNAPTTDSDGNGLPDLCQKNKAVNASISGSGNMDWSFTGATGPFTISGSLSRSANSQTGSYSMTVANSSGSVVYSGSWSVLYIAGAITYQREPTNRVNLSLTSYSPDGTPMVATGSTGFTVNNPNQIALPLFYLTNSDQETRTVYASTLNRTGNRYVGNLRVLDGNSATSWPDYTSWVVEITDPNDSNTNGVPDLSDLGIAPSILQQPRSLTVGLGQAVSLSVQASGTPPLNYVWRRNGSALPEGTDAILVLTNAQPVNAGNYTVLVTNLAGSVTSSVATLTVVAPPIITTNPQTQAVRVGSNAIFTVAASGSNLQYRWWWEAGGKLRTYPTWTNTSLSLSSVQPANAGSFYAVVTNLGGSVTSAVAMLIVAPTITNQPQSQTIVAGSNANFQVGATGVLLSYRWQFNNTNLPWATNATLLVTNVQSANAGNYRAILTNPAGSITTAVAQLMVVVLPKISPQPASQTVALGSNVNLSVGATGTAPISYQWRFGGVNLQGATANSLLRTNFQPGNQGSYDVVVSNLAGTTISEPAWLYLNGPLRFTNTFVGDDGFLRARLLGVAGTSYVIQASSDLTTWTPAQTNLAVRGIIDFVDTDAANHPQRFYRAW